MDGSCCILAFTFELQGFADSARDDDIQRVFGLGQFAGPAFAEIAIKLGIVGFPEKMAERDGVEIELTIFKGKPNGSIAERMHFIDAPTLFAVRVPSPVDHDAVTGFKVGPGALLRL